MSWLGRKTIATQRRYIEYRSRKAVEANSHLMDVIRRYMAASNSTGCSFSDYWYLYTLLRRHKPRHVLELGTGISTAVIATALAENEAAGGPAGALVSMEEEQRWFDVAMAALPEACRTRTNIVLSPTQADGFGIFRGMRYRDLPDIPFDFVFVDGPNYRMSDGDFGFDFDLLHVIDKSATPVSGLIDKRVSTVFVLQQLLGTDKVRFDRVRGIGVVEAATSGDLTYMRDSPASSAYRFDLGGTVRIA